MGNSARDFKYPFDEFMADFDTFRTSYKAKPRAVKQEPSETPTPLPYDENIRRVSAYMKNKYPEEPQCTWRRVTFISIMSYIADHIDDLNQGHYAVSGEISGEALVRNHVFRAVHYYYTKDGIKPPTEVLCINEVMKLADTYWEGSENEIGGSS